MNIMKISSLLAYVDNGYLTPCPSERHNQWQSDRIRNYLLSLYRGFPSGSFVFWNPSSPLPSAAAGEAPTQINYIVDGLQRITAIYSALTGKRPPFSSGVSVESWTWAFHVEREVFSCDPGVSGEPLWIDLASFFRGDHGIGAAIAALYPYASAGLPTSEIVRRITTLHNLNDRLIPVEYMPREFTLDACTEFRTATSTPRGW